MSCQPLTHSRSTASLATMRRLVKDRCLLLHQAVRTPTRISSFKVIPTTERRFSQSPVRTRQQASLHAVGRHSTTRRSKTVVTRRTTQIIRQTWMMRRKSLIRKTGHLAAVTRRKRARGTTRGRVATTSGHQVDTLKPTDLHESNRLILFDYPPPNALMSVTSFSLLTSVRG